MEQEKLNKIIRDHKEWLETDGKKGVWADLSRADLLRKNTVCRLSRRQGGDFHEQA